MKLTSRGRLRGLAAIVLTAAALAPACAPSQIAGSSPSGGLTPIGAPPVIPAGATLGSAVSGSQDLTLDVVLTPRNLHGLANLAARVSRPGDPLFHHYLGRDQLAATFGQDPSVAAGVAQQFRSMGFETEATTDHGLVLQVRGPASLVEQRLHVGLHHVRLRDGQQIFTNTRPPQLPAGLAREIRGISGLSNQSWALSPSAPAPGPHLPRLAPTSRPDALRATPKSTIQGSAAPASTSPTVDCQAAVDATVSAAENSGIYPGTFGVLDGYYGINEVPQRGAGTTVALLEPFMDDYNTSDLTAFESCYGITTQVHNVLVDGGPGSTTDPSGMGEEELDIETVLGVAPAANVDVYMGPPSTGSIPQGNAIIDTLSQAVNDDQASEISLSIGACEQLSDPNFVLAFDGLAQQAAVQGQSIFISSGDSGSAGCEQIDTSNTSLDVDYPASDPWVTAVGGTENIETYLILQNLDLNTLAEGPWNDGCTSGGLCAAGGGGESTLYAKPTWQTVDSSITRRQVPDVSANASSPTGYLIYEDGGWAVYYGTSGSSPLWAGVMATVNSACAAVGSGPVGFADPALYADAAANPSDFLDIPTAPLIDGVQLAANNDATGTNLGQYPSTTGYDMATGLGSPNVEGLATHLCASSATSLSDLSGISNTDGRAELFATNSTGQVLHNYQLNPHAGPWSGWTQLDPTTGLTTLTAITNTDGRAELFATNNTGQVLHNYQLNPHAGPWSGWGTL